MLPSRSGCLSGSERAKKRSLRAPTGRNRLRNSRGAHWYVARMGGTPQTGHIGPPRDLKKSARHIEIFFKCLVESKIAPGAPQSCQSACLYPGECGGMSCATSRPGTGPGRAGFRRATFAFALPSRLRSGQKTLTPRSHRAESLEKQPVSTLVCRTYGWDPENGAYRAATGPGEKVSRHLDFFRSVLSKVKSRPALPSRAKPLACTLGSVRVCHARPQGPSRARAG